MTITYEELSKFPFNQRERILAEMQHPAPPPASPEYAAALEVVIAWFRGSLEWGANRAEYTPLDPGDLLDQLDERMAALHDAQGKGERGTGEPCKHNRINTKTKTCELCGIPMVKVKGRHIPATPAEGPDTELVCDAEFKREYSTLQRNCTREKEHKGNHVDWLPPDYGKFQPAERAESRGE